MSDRSGGADKRIVVGIMAVVVVLLGMVAIGLLTADDGSEDVAVDAPLAATPVTTATAAGTPPGTAPDPDPAGTGAPSEGEGAGTPTGGPEGTPGTGDLDDASGATAPPAEATPDGPREPGDGDAADFAATVATPDAPVETVIADLDGDDRTEVVVASTRGGRVRVDVGGWTGSAYEVVFSGEGGSAEELAEVLVTDINDVPDTTEVVVRARSGAQGESLSVWGTGPDGLGPLRAVGGCWDGSHVYGIVGATLGSGRITATCDGSPDPIVAWPSDIYAWDPSSGTFAYERTLR